MTGIIVRDGKIMIENGSIIFGDPNACQCCNPDLGCCLCYFTDGPGDGTDENGCGAEPVCISAAWDKTKICEGEEITLSMTIVNNDDETQSALQGPQINFYDAGQIAAGAHVLWEVTDDGGGTVQTHTAHTIDHPVSVVWPTWTLDPGEEITYTITIKWLATHASDDSCPVSWQTLYDSGFPDVSWTSEFTEAAC